MQSIGSIKTYKYGTSKDLVSDKEEFNCNTIINGTQNENLWWCFKRNHKKN